MPLQKFPIQQFSGVDRNSAEGSVAPRELRNLYFRRANGLSLFGGRASAGVTTDASLVTYDDANLSLLSDNTVWTNTFELLTLDATKFGASPLVLIPRGGIITEYKKTSTGYEGSALIRSPDGELTESDAAPTVTFTQGGAGPDIPIDTYEFLWMLEAPTDAGFIAYAIGSDSFTVTGAATEYIELTLDDVIPQGHIVRFYWRTTQAGYTRFAARVSNGNTAVEVRLQSDSFSATIDALVNFAPNRTELHEGRNYGIATPRPFVSLLPDSAVTRKDSYFQRIFSEDKTLDAFTTTAPHVFSADDELLQWRIRQLKVTRVTSNVNVDVPLVYLVRDSDATQTLAVFIRFPGNGGNPQLRIRYKTTTLSETINGQIPPLGSSSGSVLELNELNMTLLIDDVDTTTSVSNPTLTFKMYYTITSGGSFSFSGGPSPTTVTGVMNGWGDWDNVDDTLVSLFSMPGASSSWEVRFVSATALTATASKSYLADVTQYLSGLTWSRVATWTPPPSPETWTLADASNVVLVTEPIDLQDVDLIVSQPRKTIVYSAVNSVNRGVSGNLIALTASASNEITALTSTPAGLLIFMENETWLLSGDPDNYSASSVQRFSGTLGCDVGVIPARLGGVVFPIYKGELYMVNLGMGDVDFGSGVENIGRPVWLREDGFVQVVAEPQSNMLVARTVSGRVYRYDSVTKSWMDDPFSLAGNNNEAIDNPTNASLVILEDNFDLLFEDGGAVRAEDTSDNSRIILLPACLCQQFGTRYLVRNQFEYMDFMIEDDVYAAWSHLDLGDKLTAKLWRRLEIVTSDSYVGPPVLTYSVDGGSDRSVTGVSSGKGRWVFNFLRGDVGAYLDVKVALPGFTREDVLEVPIVIEAALRNRSRGRVA